MTKTYRRHRTLLVSAAVAAALASGASLAAQSAPEELELVVVTGSRIAAIQAEGPSPVTVVTAEDIQARGFTTVQEAVAALSQITGIAQNETQAGTFTQNANAIDVRGLGPGRTLVLVDGRRMADYPLPYNGESNFVNLSAIPAAAVERIEVLSGGASAIYGSDAVAGVLNVILKKRTDSPFNLDVRYGDTTQGGGQSLRVQATTSFEIGRLNMLFAAEVLDRKPIYAFQRDFQDSVNDNPDPAGRINGRALLRLDPLYGVYMDPGANACAAFPTLTYSFRPGRGNYCGDEKSVSQFTLRNDRSRGSLFGRFTYDLDSVELYGSVNLFHSTDRSDPDYTWFSTDFIIPEQYFFDVSEDPNGDGGVFTTMQRFFQPFEIGGYKARQTVYREQVVDYSAGVRGEIAGSWRYDLTLSGSEYDLTSRQPVLLNQPLVDYFLGPQLRDGSGNLQYDPLFDFYPVYNVNWAKFYTPVSPQTFQSMLAYDRTRADSYNRSASLVLNGDLLQLPAGPLSSAVVFEAAKQAYDIQLSPELLNGELFGLTGTGGGGSRKRYAAGLELSVPVVEQVRLKLAGRYDNYDDITSVNGAFTYNAGIEYRPTSKVLLRGSYATSFRAPDMHYVFSDPSGYFTYVADEYLCRRDEPGVSLAACSLGEVQIQGERQGNPLLKEETSDSYTFGFVVEPVSKLQLSVDYYDIKLKGAVLDDPISRLLETEADCRLGVTKGGAPVDINSGRCQATLSRVQRRPNDGGTESEYLQLVATGPINTAKIHTSGLDAAARYTLNANAWGRFDFQLAYTQVFKFDQQDFAEDPVEDKLKSLQFFDWHSRINGSVTWTKGAFSTTAYVIRNGSIPNWAETGRLGSYTTANLSARYSGLLGGDAYVGFSVQNLFDRDPPKDPTYDTYPYYSDYNYSPVGREVFLEIGTHF